MARALARSVIGVVVGVVVLGVVVAALQALGATMHPLPDGVDPGNPAHSEALQAHLATVPALVLFIAWVSEVLGAFLGGSAAGIVASGPKGLASAGRTAAAVVVGLALVGSVINWMSFPHPLWFIVGQLVGYPLALMLVWRVLAGVNRRRQAR